MYYCSPPSPYFPPSISNEIKHSFFFSLKIFSKPPPPPSVPLPLRPLIS